MIQKRKIALVGAGQIGGTIALLASLKGLGEVVLYDISRDGQFAQGKALDILQAMALGLGHGVKGTGRQEDIIDADVVIVTAGVARKPGMSRDELLGINAGVVSLVGRTIREYCPKAFVICVTNPLDAMVHLMRKVSGLPPERVVGMAGLLDTCRFKAFLAEELGVFASDVDAMVLGAHDDTMVAVLSQVKISGLPLEAFFAPKDRAKMAHRLDAVVERTRKGGAEIVSLLGSGSAFFAPAACALEMATAYLLDQKRVLPCSAYCDGVYGLSETYIGVPAVIGARGIERIIEIEFSPEEKKQFLDSIASVARLRQAVDQLGIA